MVSTTIGFKTRCWTFDGFFLLALGDRTLIVANGSPVMARNAGQHGTLGPVAVIII